MFHPLFAQAIWVSDPIRLLIIAIVVGAIVYLVNLLAPIPEKWKQVINVLAGVFVLILAILFLARLVGL